MRTNGLIFFRFLSRPSENGCNLNEYGEVAPPSEEWSGGILCNISTNSDTRKGRYVDGQFRQSSYTVLIEDSLRCCDTPPLRVRIERGGENLGEFQIQSIERLPSVGRIRIVV